MIRLAILNSIEPIISAAIIKPVIFLAFANDRDNIVGYLRNLADEARWLREVNIIEPPDFLRCPQWSAYHVVENAGDQYDAPITKNSS